jgi:hypothetical protein
MLLQNEFTWIHSHVVLKQQKDRIVSIYIEVCERLKWHMRVHKYTNTWNGLR